MFLIPDRRCAGVFIVKWKQAKNVSPHFTMNTQEEADIRAVSLVRFFSEKEMNERKAPRNQSALRVPDPAHQKQVAALPLPPFLDVCLGRLLAGAIDLF